MNYKALFPSNTDIQSHIKIWKDVTKGRKPNQVIQTAKTLDSRTLVLISRGHRVLLVKLKPTDKDLESSTTWSVDDIKSIEYTHPIAFALHLSRTAFFCTDDTQQLKHFMGKLIKLCQKYAKVPPLVKDKVSIQRINVFQNLVEDDQVENAAAKVDYSVLSEIWQDGDGYESMKNKLDQELDQLQAANVHSMVEILENKKKLQHQLSETMDDLNGMGIWLEAYYARVMDLSKNVNTIESEHKKIQILFANRASLLKTLKEMLGSIDIDEREKYLIQNADLSDDLGSVKAVVVSIYQKLHKPQDEFKLKCVQEKLSDLNAYNVQLSVRLSRHIVDGGKSISKRYLEDPKRNAGNTFRAMVEMEEFLSQYYQLLNWMNEVNPSQFSELYMDVAKVLNGVWQNDIQRFVQSRMSKVNTLIKTILFEGLEKQKPIDRIKKRKDNDKGSTTLEESKDLIPYEEVLNQLLSSISSKLVRQHNFFDDLFFFSSDISFNKIVEQNILLSTEKLGEKRPRQENIKVEKRLSSLMQTIFPTLLNEINRIIDEGIKHDEISIFQFIVIISSKYKDFSGCNVIFYQDWLNNVKSRLLSAWDDFLRRQLGHIQSKYEDWRKKKDSDVFPSIQILGVFIEKIESYLVFNQDQSITGMAAHAYEILGKEFVKLIELAVDCEKDAFDAQILSMSNFYSFSEHA
eukprot:NODE_217_length_12479_cov_0.651212.p2 type:complete len:687 gc:universal NODE_217_length_12479_cov_0.651212:7872-5812(-)